MFWHRKPTAAEEAEGKAVMDALDETVNGKPQKAPPSFNIQCGRCKIEMTADPQKRGRTICPKCRMVLLVSLVYDDPNP